MLMFTSGIGTGGEVLKEHLNQNLDRSEATQRAALVEEADGSCLIIIDPRVPECHKKGRGRPRKFPTPGEQDFTITID